MARVMIVEDDQTALKLLKILLEEVHGFQVSVSRRGSEVVALATEAQPDVFLIDYHLIDMDGITLIRTLRGTPRFAHTPIVMASGMDVSDEAIKAGANSFLTKPYEPDDLANLFKTLTAVQTNAGQTAPPKSTPQTTATSGDGKSTAP